MGGGEPSVNSKLEKLYDFAIERDIPTLILSNGARYIPKIAEGIQKGLFSICLSPDAGSKETFIKVKGHSDNQYNNRCDELARNAIKNII